MTTRQRQTKDETRRTILEHAYEMYRDGRLDRRDVKVAAVLSELGYTTGAAYYIWPNQAAFRNDLMAHIAENVQYAFVSTITDRIDEVRSGGASFEEMVLHGADLYVEYFLAQEDFYISLRFYEDPNPPQHVIDAVSRGYERVRVEVQNFFELVLTYHGRRMASPDYTIDHLVQSVTALVEGFALRCRIQPEQSKFLVSHKGSECNLCTVNLLHLVMATTCEV